MDLATKVEISALFEVYGNSLTDKQKQVVDFCVLQDLSLGEVSDLLNISRQAVKYTLDNAILSMLKLEEELKILDKFQDIKHKLTKLLESTNDTKLRQQINKILEEL
ncbi:MAG: transcriptional regulator [Clostridia bacterium]|nr:transcriptional regulator [Clostridia bacterium]